MSRARNAALLGAVALAAAAAFWVARGVGPWAGDRGNVWHHYEYLAEGFLSGHTYLSVDPDPRLLALADPYDPGANAAYRLWDASLFRGRYYLYYGPSPALAMVAWRLIAGRVPEQALTVAAFAAAGFLGLSLLVAGIGRRHFPGLTPPRLFLVLVTAFHASWLPVVLRRPSVWELPIVAAAALLWWALYFLWRFHESKGRWSWAAAAGIALALLMGSRATCVLSAGVLCLLFVAGAGMPASRRGGLWAPCLAAAGGIALLAYNHARFGSWSEFGQSYQLWGMDERHVAHMSPAYAAFNAWTYFLSTPRFGPYFPFLHPYWAEAFPTGYISFEEVYGVLFMLPIQAAGLAAAVWWWRGRLSADLLPARVTLVGAAAASLLASTVFLMWAGACSRYIAEMVAGSTVVSMVGFAALLGTPAATRRGALARTAAVCAAFWTMASTWLASAEFRGFMRHTHPAAYSALAHTLDFPSDWWARASGVAYGPLDLEITVPDQAPGTQTVLVASGRPQLANQLILEALAGKQLRLILCDNQHTVLETPPIAAPGGMLRIRLSAPWLYPPGEHPYWDRVPDPLERGRLRRLFSIDWGAGRSQTLSDMANDAIAFEPVIRAPEPGQAGAVRVAQPPPR